MDKQTDYEITRVFLMGLPFSGLADVAHILKEKYDFKIFDVDAKMKEMNHKKAESKEIRDICFNEFDQTKRAVILCSHYNVKTFLELKKRNFINFVFVDTSFKKRYENYLRQSELQSTEEIATQFMKLQENYETEEYLKCLEFVRVRISFFTTKDKLETEIQEKKDLIIRPFRPSWDQYFMKMADIARRRSNCMKSSVGCVIVNQYQRVVSTGYNGTPKGLTSCYKNGCHRCNDNQGKQLDQCLCLHAEQSAIIEVGIGKTKGCTLYTTYYPCFSCAKVIKQAGISKIFYMDEYEKEDSGKTFIQNNFSQKDVMQIGVDNLYY